MIPDFITGILSTWPHEIAALAVALAAMAPIIVALYVLWLLADLAEWLIDRAEHKRQAAARQRVPYRTASERQIERDIVAMWRRHPGFDHTHPTQEDRVVEAERAAFDRATQPRVRGNGPPPTVLAFQPRQPRDNA